MRLHRQLRCSRPLEPDGMERDAAVRTVLFYVSTTNCFSSPININIRSSKCPNRCNRWVTTLAYVSSGLFVPVEELGVSAGLLGTFRSAGGSVGNAIFSTILTSVANKNLGNNLAGAAIGAGFDPTNLGALIPAVIENAVGVPFAFDAVPGVTPAVIAATGAAFKETYSNAFRMVCFATIPFCLVATGVAFWVKDPSYLLTNHVAVKQEKEVLSGVERRPEAVVGKRVNDGINI